MSAELSKWKDITPEDLIPAVTAIRASFESNAFQWGYRTGKGCYALLHPGDQISLKAEDEEAFLTLVGSVEDRALRRFDDLGMAGTAPSVFKAFFDLHRDGLKTTVSKHFDELLSIGLANPGLLTKHPVEWAHAHLQLLIDTKTYRRLIESWIRGACDKQDYAKAYGDSDRGEMLFWKTWRAPRLIHMQPSGNALYDEANAWTREDEVKSVSLLQSLADKFIGSIEARVCKKVEASHIALAKMGKPKAHAKDSPPRPEDSPGRRNEGESSRTAPDTARLGPKRGDMSRYWNSTNLTRRQRECMSLRLEYGLSKIAIARRLGIHRTTVDEHLSAAIKRVDSQAAKERAAKNFAKVDPGGIRRR